MQMDVSQLRERLKHVRFCPLVVSEGLTVCLRSFSPFKPETNLQAQVDLVWHITLHTPNKYNPSFWGPATRDTVKVLSALRPTGYLDFGDCTWPFEASVCKELALQLPTSYTGWALHTIGRGLPERMVLSVLRVYREKLFLPEFRYWDRTPGVQPMGLSRVRRVTEADPLHAKVIWLSQECMQGAPAFLCTESHGRTEARDGVVACIRRVVASIWALMPGMH